MAEPMSGAAAGAENVRRLRAYLNDLRAAGFPLPVRQGKVNVSAVALACGFDRQVLYKNPTAKGMLEEAEAVLGIEVDLEATENDKPAVRGPDRRDRRIHTLEQENAALRAEVAGLRERLRWVRHVEDHMTETGRRVAPLLPSLGETGK